MREIVLEPIKEKESDFLPLERRIREFFKKNLYLPLLEELRLPKATLRNAEEDVLAKAIREGRITIADGLVRGKLNAEITKALKKFGALWDKDVKAFRFASIPAELSPIIAFSEMRFRERMMRIDIKLTQIMPATFASKLKTSDLFDTIIRKTEKNLASTLKNITVLPSLTDETRKKISVAWQSNMDLWIKDFTEKEILRLREDVQKAVFKGERRSALQIAIRKSFNVTDRKAKFLARQETALLTAKLKEERYKAAGVNQYIWKCVAGSKLHPVRPSHKVLDGKVFSFDDPPVTTMPGEPERRNNPGEDYNCRCYAKPLVKIK